MVLFLFFLEKNEEMIPKKDDKPAMTAARPLGSDFSDNDEDMNVDFHLDSVEEDDRKEEDDGKNQRKSTLLPPEIKYIKDSSGSCVSEEQVLKHSQKKTQHNMDVDISATSANSPKGTFKQLFIYCI